MGFGALSLNRKGAFLKEKKMHACAPVCGYVHKFSCAQAGQKRALGSLAAKVISGCELCNMEAGN